MAFITNSTSDFWKAARKGCEKADAELPDVTVAFKTNRALYLGADNLAAGRQAGELIKPALPQGWKDHGLRRQTRGTKPTGTL